MVIGQGFKPAIWGDAKVVIDVNQLSSDLLQLVVDIIINLKHSTHHRKKVAHFFS